MYIYIVSLITLFASFSAHLLSFHTPDLANQPIRITAERPPSAFVNDMVSAIDGAVCLSMPHLQVPGHVPLHLVQYYNSQSSYTSWLGAGMTLNYSFWIAGTESSEKTHDKYDKYALTMVAMPGGSIIRCIGKRKVHGTSHYFLDPAVIHKGLTNCGSFELSAQTNMKNIRVKEKIVNNSY